MKGKQRFDVKVNFEDIPIVKLKNKSLDEIGGVFKELRRKFK